MAPVCDKPEFGPLCGAALSIRERRGNLSVRGEDGTEWNGVNQTSSRDNFEAGVCRVIHINL